MSLNTNYPVINPRLSASFAIFTSAFICLVLMLMILEQLGLPRATIGQLIIITPVLFYVAIGIYVRTISVDDYFISGQRVPALYNGLSLSVNCLGGIMVLSFTGALFFGGVDVFALGIGICGGLAIMALLFSSYLRKTGAYTLPGFFALRFNSRLLRFAAALLIVPPCLMLLAAEIKLGAITASYFLPLNERILAAIGVGIVVITIILGGMRSLTWTQCAQAIVLLFGISIPVIAVSVMLTNLPLPQFTYGQTLQTVSQLEISKSLLQGAGNQQTVQDALILDGFQAFTRPFGKIFGTLTAADFVLLALTVMIGSAVLPAQIARLSTTPNIPSVRKSLGWAVLFAGFLMVTMPAYAVFTKYFVAQDLSGQPFSEVPAWGRTAQALDMIKISGDQLNPGLGESQTAIKRDAVALLLPLAAELPYVFFGVVAAAAIAAILAAAAGHLLAIANVLSNDIYCGLINRAASPSRRLFIARLSILIAAAASLSLALDNSVDPVTLALWALSLAGATFFPVLALSIWSARVSPGAAVLGMLTGFAVTAFYIVMTQTGETRWLGIDNLMAGMLGAPVAAAVTIVFSVLSPRPDDQAKEIVEEMRLAGGETIYARSLRLAARGKAVRP